MILKNYFGLNRIDEFLLLIEAAMFHPTDNELMRGNFCKNYLDYVIDELGIEKDPPFAIFNKARKYKANNLGTCYKHGLTAGMIFLNLVDMQMMKVRDLSFDKALYILLNLDNKHAIEVNKKKPIKSETTLRDDVWKKYRSVAHLWGAYIMVLDGIYKTSDLEEDPYSYLAMIYNFQNRFKKMNLGFDIYEIQNPQTMTWNIKNLFESIPFEIQLKLMAQLNDGSAKYDRLEKIKNLLEEYSSYKWKRHNPKY